MIVRKITSQNDYADGYNYLFKYFPKNIHVLSAYEMTSFNRTLQMLKYDIDGQILSGISADEYVDRYICYYENNAIGVAIKASFQEYSSALDFEEYIIIIADNIEAFQSLLYEVRKKHGKYEIITFRDEERLYLSDSISNAYLHLWDVYKICPEDYSDICQPFMLSHIEDAEINNSSELTPIRYYVFKTNKIEGYSVWTYFEKNKTVLIASVMPYFQKTAEIKVLLINDNLLCPDTAARFLSGVVYNCSDNYNNAVIRVKKPIKALLKILDCGQFELIAKEQHVHLED